MSHRKLAVVVAVAASVMAIYGLAGSSRLSGAVVLRFSDRHGIHRDDLLIVISFLACLWVAVTLWRRP